MTSAFGEIVALAKDPTPSGRRRLASCFGDAFFIHAAGFSPSEKTIALEIMAALLRSAEIEIRKELAQRFASEAAIPRSLAVGLANDVIEVARPILLYSPVLQESDLVGVIEHKGTAHRMAIANRPHVTSRVTEALVQAREPIVAMTLLNNIAVNLSSSTIKALANEAMEHLEISHALLMRPEITAEVAEHLYWLVSQELRSEIKSRFDINPVVLDRALQATVTSLIERDNDPAHRKTMAERLIVSGAVTPSFLIELLKARGIDLFRELMMTLTGLTADAQDVIFQPYGTEPLALICRALGFNKVEAASFIMLVRDRVAGQNQFDPAGLSDALATFGRLTEGDANTVLWQWQSDPSYLLSLTARRTTPPVVAAN